MEPKTQLERLEELERKIDHLKVSYEKYFRGIDRLEPWPERRDVERRVREFLRDPPRTTMARFRFANLRQRLTSLETYWNRVARQIEEGTHPLVLMRAKRRLGGARPEGTRTGDDVVAIDIDMDLELDGGLDAVLHPDCVFWSPIVFSPQANFDVAAQLDRQRRHP